MIIIIIILGSFPNLLVTIKWKTTIEKIHEKKAFIYNDFMGFSYLPITTRLESQWLNKVDGKH